MIILGEMTKYEIVFKAERSYTIDAEDPKIARSQALDELKQDLNDINPLDMFDDVTENPDDNVVLTGEQIDYIVSWLIMDAMQYHDVLSSFADMQDHNTLMQAIQAAIEAYNGGARNG